MTQMVLLGLLTFVASAIGTSTGFGTSTVMIPVMVLFVPHPVALLFVGVIHLFNDIWKVLLFKRGFNKRLLLAFGLSGVAASFLGATLSLQENALPLRHMLGGFLLAYVLFLLLNRQWALPRTTGASVCGGLLSGFFAGLFGVGGAVRGAFLAAFDLPKDVYIFMSGFVALFIDITRVSRYIWGGTRLQAGLLVALAISVPASLAGAYGARIFLNRLPQKYFRVFVAFFLAAIGFKLLVWG